MSSANLLTLAVLACMMFYGSALVCFECSTIAGGEIKECNKPVNQTCDAGYNGCMLVSLDRAPPMVDNYMMRNCSSNCDEAAYCKAKNDSLSGQLSGCKVHCCTGDRCNLNFPMTPAAGSTTQTPSHETTTTAAASTIQVFSGITFGTVLFVRIVSELMA